jgi:hypothetical protein
MLTVDEIKQNHYLGEIDISNEFWSSWARLRSFRESKVTNIKNLSPQPKSLYRSKRS